MKPSHVSAILEREFEASGAGGHTPVMLWGAPGTGKSEIVAAVAARQRVALIDVRLSQLEPTDLRGIPFRVQDRVQWSVPALLWVYAHRALGKFAGELQALKAQARAELVVHACDERLAPEGPWRFAAWQAVCLPPRLAGGGGTRFTPAFEWVEREGLRPDLLVYFTDAQGEFPARAPDYPVLWLVKGRAPVPFGERAAFG